jgi:hypothetical protein
MIGKPETVTSLPVTTLQSVNYIKQMLPELAELARKEKAEMLVFLLEMAFTEATDLLSGRSDSIKVDRNHATGMAMKPSGKI